MILSPGGDLMRNNRLTIAIVFICIFCLSNMGMAQSTAYGKKIFDPGKLKPTDSVLKIKKGDVAPLFTLPAISGEFVSLHQYIGNRNVMLTFIPAAWTPVCSDQWPGYNITRLLFEAYDTVVIGISTDNIPTLFAWTQEMGELWFDVVSDFWPHGAVSQSYGVLRSDGMADRAIILINKKGIIHFTHIGDINVRPNLKLIVDQLKTIN